MPGCCLVLALLIFGPRAALVLAWLFTDWYAAFESRLVALLGFVLLPWTSLAWMLVFFHNHGRIDGGYVLVLIGGVLLDLSAYGGSRRGRDRYDEWQRVDRG
jgi:hypothetical protein